MGVATDTQRDDSEPVGSGAEAAGGPSHDRLFHVLRNRRRRYAIHHLKRASEPVDVGDLATQVAAWENEVALDEVGAQQRRRVYNALQQTHVPELEESGIVEVDRRSVELTDRGDELDIYLEVIGGREIPWSKYYVGMWIVGVAVTAVSGLDVEPFATLPDIAAGVFLVVALGISATVHYYDQHANRVGGDEKPPELRDE